MILLEGVDSPHMPIWTSFLTFGLGIFVPNPKYKSTKIRVANSALAPDADERV